MHNGSINFLRQYFYETEIIGFLRYDVLLEKLANGASGKTNVSLSLDMQSTLHYKQFYLRISWFNQTMESKSRTRAAVFQNGAA